ncbi:NAD(P)-dependent oxidoreductase [Rhodanobacter sp. BL-MT-08]
MKLALIGAPGHIGRHIAQHALERGHQITAIVRRDTDLPAELAGSKIVLAPLDSPTGLQAALAGHDAVASAFGPGAAAPNTLVSVAGALIVATRQSTISRLLVVGGAGSLDVQPGVRLLDTPAFPALYRAQALAHWQALMVYREAVDLSWTVMAPAASIGEGETRGHFRVQAAKLLVDEHGDSRISYGDYAVAFIDELEQPQFVRQLATAAY